MANKTLNFIFIGSKKYNGMYNCTKYVASFSENQIQLVKSRNLSFGSKNAFVIGQYDSLIHLR